MYLSVKCAIAFRFNETRLKYKIRYLAYSTYLLGSELDVVVDGVFPCWPLCFDLPVNPLDFKLRPDFKPSLGSTESPGGCIM